MNTTKRSLFKLRKPCSHMDVTFMDVENQVWKPSLRPDTLLIIIIISLILQNRQLVFAPHTQCTHTLLLQKLKAQPWQDDHCAQSFSCKSTLIHAHGPPTHTTKLAACNTFAFDRPQLLMSWRQQIGVSYLLSPSLPYVHLSLFPAYT